MFITKSEELHMELAAAKYEAKAAIREAQNGDVSVDYARCAVNVWDDTLDRWEGNNMRPLVSLRRRCIGKTCTTSAKRWVAGRYDTGDVIGFTACRKHAEAKVVLVDGHFLARRTDFIEDARLDDYYTAGNCPQDGGEY